MLYCHIYVVNPFYLFILGPPPPPGPPARSLLKTRGQRKKYDSRENTVARDSKNVDAHRQPLRRGESHLKDYLRKYLLRSKTDDRLANRNLGRRGMDKRRKKDKKSK